MKKTLLFAVSAFALGFAAQPAMAQDASADTRTKSSSSTTTVTTTTKSEPVVTKPAKIRKTTTSKTNRSGEEYTFVTFDLNNDGVVTKAEVGEKLFYIYDRDGNEVIDNLEWKNKKVMTIVPMEKETLTYVDTDADGVAEKEKYTREEFIEESKLARFSDDLDGLSAREFLAVDFRDADYNRDNFIDVKEWRKTYISALRKGDQQLERYLTQ